LASRRRSDWRLCLSPDLDRLATGTSLSWSGTARLSYHDLTAAHKDAHSKRRWRLEVEGGRSMPEDGPPLPRRLARAASLMAVATTASRVLGLLREVAAAWLFGATNAKAAYVIAYYLPFFVQRLLLGGTLSIVFIPTISRYLARGELDEARRISGTLLLGPRIGIRGLAIAWIAGTAAQFLVQLPAARRYGLRLGRVDLAHPALRELARLAVPAMLGLAIVEINAYVDRFFASQLPLRPEANPVAVLDYAYEIVQAPAGIFAISIATAVFPLLSRHAATDNHDDLRGTASLALRTLLFVILPVTALVLALREPLVRLLFQRGEFGPVATRAVAATLGGYAVGLPAIAAYYVVTRTYYALQDMVTPVRI